MASWTSYTVTSTRRVWEVPAAQPWGAVLGDVYSAIATASNAYREEHGLPKGGQLADDALRFHVTDDSILVSFTVETEATP